MIYASIRLMMGIYYPSWHRRLVTSLTWIVSIGAILSGLVGIVSAFLSSESRVLYAATGVTLIFVGIFLIRSDPVSALARFMQSRVEASDEASRKLTQQLKTDRERGSQNDFQ